MTPPGTEFKRIVSFDGNKVVAYSPDSGEATISDPAVGDELNEILVYIMPVRLSSGTGLSQLSRQTLFRQIYALLGGRRR